MMCGPRMSSPLAISLAISPDVSPDVDPGAATVVLSVSDGGFALEASVCGGANSEAEQRVAAWIRPARELFPPMDQLAPEGTG